MRKEKIYKCLAREKGTGRTFFVECSFSSIKEFRINLRCNGCVAVRGIVLEKEIYDYAIEHTNFTKEDIKNVKAMFKAERKEIKAKKEKSLDNCLSLVDEWKLNELEAIKEGLKIYDIEIQQLKNNKEEKEQQLKSLINYYKKLNGCEPEKEYTSRGLMYKDSNLRNAFIENEEAKARLVNYERLNSLYKFYGHTSQFEDIVKKQIDQRFDILQAKVEKKIGKIIKIENIVLNNYLFKGENGFCKVQVILAGGYNIQELHTRWIVKNA